MNHFVSKYYVGFKPVPRRHPWYKVLSAFPGVLQKFITPVGESAEFRNLSKPFREIREKENPPSVSSYTEELEGDYNLLCDLKELFPIKKLPDNYEIIGPVLPDIPGIYEPPLIKTDPSKKTILGSMGSSGSWESVKFLNDPFFHQYNIVTAMDKQQVLKGPHISAFGFMKPESIYDFVDL